MRNLGGVFEDYFFLFELKTLFLLREKEKGELPALFFTSEQFWCGVVFAATSVVRGQLVLDSALHSRSDGSYTYIHMQVGG